MQTAQSSRKAITVDYIGLAFETYDSAQYRVAEGPLPHVSQDTPTVRGFFKK